MKQDQLLENMDQDNIVTKHDKNKNHLLQETKKNDAYSKHLKVEVNYDYNWGEDEPVESIVGDSSSSVFTNLSNFFHSSYLKLCKNKHPQSKEVFILKNNLKEYDTPELSLKEMIEADYGSIARNKSFLIPMDEYPGFFYYSRPKSRYSKITGSLPATTVDLCKPNKKLYQIASKIEKPCQKRNFSYILDKLYRFHYMQSDIDKNRRFLLLEKMQDNLKPFFEKKQHYTYRVLGQRNPKGNLLFQMGFIDKEILQECDYKNIPKIIQHGFIEIVDLSNQLTDEDVRALTAVFKSIEYNESLNIKVSKTVLSNQEFINKLLSINQDFVIDSDAYKYLLDNAQSCLSKESYQLLSNNKSIDIQLLDSIIKEMSDKNDVEQKIKFLNLNILKLSLKKKYNKSDLEHLKIIIHMINNPKFSNDLKDKYKNMHGLFRHLSNSYSRICDDLNIEDIDNLNGFTVLGNPELTYNHKLRHEKQKSKIIRIIGGKSQYMPTPITGKVSDEKEVSEEVLMLFKKFVQGNFAHNDQLTNKEFKLMIRDLSQGMTHKMIKVIEKFNHFDFSEIMCEDIKYCNYDLKYKFIALCVLGLYKEHYTQESQITYLEYLVSLIEVEPNILIQELYKNSPGLFKQLKIIYQRLLSYSPYKKILNENHMLTEYFKKIKI
ncbi:hypothetical protein AB837_00529 [bacterium AB1]|nr:hypothetical protein AB837_00529 [bacterium AB1]